MKKQRIRLPRRDGLVGEWLLNSNTKDTSGNGYDWTPLNVTYSKTDRGYQTYAGIFNGSNAYMDASISSQSANAQLSVSLYVRRTWNGNGTYNGLVQFQNGSSIARFALWIWPSNVLYVFNSDGVFQSTGYTLPLNVRTHLVLERTGTQMILYVNGVQTYSVSSSGNDGAYLVNYFRIGCRENLAEFSMADVQSVRVFNRVLSADEIRDWYLEGLRALGGSSLSGLMDGLVAYYDFRGDANDIISGYDGTVNGATLTTDRFGTANGAYSFNGTTDNIYSWNWNLLSNGSISVSTWVKFNSLSNNSYILSRWWLSVDWSFIISFETSDWLVFYTHTAPTDNRLKFNVIPSTWQWYHITSVFDSDWFMRAYVNWTLAASRTCWTSLRTSGTIWWTLWNSNSPSWYAMNWSMDECKIFYSALSDEKVKALYELSKQSKLLPFA